MVCFLYAQIDLITNPKLRAKHMNRVEVLDRVGGLLLLPNTELATDEVKGSLFWLVKYFYSCIQCNSLPKVRGIELLIEVSKSVIKSPM